jgi:hypothetical protein
MAVTYADGCWRLGGGPYHALAGLANSDRLGFVTQADGLGYVRSPLRA